MQNNNELSTLFELLKSELVDYLNKRVKLLKLDAFETASISASFIGYGLIVAIIIAIIVFFILTGLAFFIGELLGSLAAGFGILALFCIVVLIVILLCGKRIRKFFIQRIILLIRKIEKIRG